MNISSGHGAQLIPFAGLALLLSSGSAHALTTGGVASASSAYSTCVASKAVDGNTTTEGWGSANAATRWWQYAFTMAKVVTNYRYYCSSSQTHGWSGSGYQPKEYTFRASDDATNWTVLVTVTNGPSGQGVWRTSAVTNATAYTYYRFNITKNTGNDSADYYVQLTEVELDGYYPGPPAGTIFTTY